MSAEESLSAITAAIAKVLELPSGAPQKVRDYYQLLLRWNARINLTGAATVEELVSDYLPDSLAMASLVPRDCRLVDVGSGGGLPAMPFAILRPDVTITLVEPRSKRVAFLRTAGRELRLSNVGVVDGRMEDVTETFDVASSMATFAPQEWLQRAQHLVAPKGQVVVFLRQAESLPAGVKASRTVDYGTPHRPRLAAIIRVSD